MEVVGGAGAPRLHHPPSYIQLPLMDGEPFQEPGAVQGLHTLQTPGDSSWVRGQAPDQLFPRALTLSSGSP